MIDKSFYISNGPFTLIFLINYLNGKISSTHIGESILISGINSLEKAKENEITFFTNLKYKKFLLTTSATVCIVNDCFNFSCKKELLLLKVDSAQYAYAKLVKLFYSSISQKLSKKIPNSVKVGKHCFIDETAVIGENVVIGDNCHINTNAVIAPGVKIGNNVFINFNVTVSYAIIGNNVNIDSGVRIGQSGFGFATYKGFYYDIFHIGRVLIGNYVNIGANTVINRGSINDTVIGDMCQIDALVQIAHNVILGKGCVIVSQVGIAGSTSIGDYTVIGGQAGLVGHLSIGKKCEIAARSMVIRDLNDNSKVGGAPAVQIKEWHKQSILINRLINKKIKDSAT